MSESIVNKVTDSGLITLDLEKWYPRSATTVFDMKDYLFMGLILKEKEFREALKKTDWTVYREKTWPSPAAQMLLFLFGLICW